MGTNGQTDESSSTKSLGRTLLNVLLNGSDHDRRKAVSVLVGPRQEGGVGDEPLSLLLRELQFLIGSSRERVHEILRSYARELVPVMKDAIPASKGADLRLLLELAKVISSPELVPALAGNIESGDRWAGVFALQALASIKEPAAVAAIVSALKVAGLRWGAIAELADIKASQTLKDVAAYLKDPSVQVRLEAIRAVVAFGDRRIIPALVRISTTDDDPEVRERAVMAVRRMAATHKVNIDEDALVRASTRIEALTRPLDRLLQSARVAGASDIHVVPGTPIAFRIHGELVNFGDKPITAA